ncbi:MAG: HAMP domain-containing sensor histidine kinase [Pseudomonadota bacterium]
MASATSIKRTDHRQHAAPGAGVLRLLKHSSSRVGGALVLGNTLALILLVMGAMALGAYRDGLIEAERKLVEHQALLTLALLTSDSACGSSACTRSPRRAQTWLEKAALDNQSRLTLYRSVGGTPQLVVETGTDEASAPHAIPVTDAMPFSALQEHLPEAMVRNLDKLIFDLPLRNRTTDETVTQQLAAMFEGAGVALSSLRSSEEGVLSASVSLPIMRNGQVMGALVAESAAIEVLGPRMRKALLPIVLIALATASVSSLILTAAVSRPIRQLSTAADRITASIGHAGSVKLPNFNNRKDDVGRLSRSFRAMARALIDRIENIDSFAADVSHELKNPLTSIKSAVETLDKCKTDAQRERLLRIIANDAERMDRLISDISSASRLDAQLATERRKAISASKLAGDVARSYRAVTDAGGPMVNFWDELDSDPKIFASPAALGRVVRNLIDNAISFSPPSGAVTIALEKDGSARHPCVLLTVTDEGPGVPEDNLESIFNRFYTSRPQGATFGSNSGLGLAIARQIVESHGGRIWCENVQGPDDDMRTGACFSLQIPLHKGGFH